MTKGYFVALRLHNPAKWKAKIAQWRKAHPDRVREATRLRVARFRARKG